MRITKREYSSLKKYTDKKPLNVVSIQLRLAISGLNPKGSNKDLQSLGVDDLQRLIAAMPSGTGTSLTSPLLTSVKKKARQSLAGLRMPHLDPDSWPQIYRMQMRLNNSRAGIKRGPLGQYLRMHPMGMSVRAPLSGRIVWDSTNAGDLHIMGPWTDVSKMLGSSSAQFRSKFGDMYDGDVNVEFDSMYGPPAGESSDWLSKISGMPLYVTVSNGALFSKTDDDGEVVLNAPGEIVDLVGSKITAIAGAAGPDSLGHKALDTISEIKGAIEDHVIPVVEMGMEARAMRLEDKLNKTLCTVSIGVGPVGKNYAMGDEQMSASEVLTLARKLR